MRYATVAVITVCALASPVRISAQGPGELQRIRTETADTFRRQVAEYEDRMRTLNLQRPMSVSARKGTHDTIINNYQSHLTAINRARTDSNTRISHVHGVSPAERQGTQRAITVNYEAEIKTLRGHEQDALHRWEDAQRR